MSSLSRIFNAATMREQTVQQEYIPRATEATLDDLYSIAVSLGEPKLGITFEPHGAEIKLHTHKVNGDYIWVRSNDYPTVKQNLAACIARAEQLIAFYKSI